MKKILTFLTLFTLSIGVSWANVATFAPSDFSGQGTSSTGSAISATVSGVTFACDKGYGTTQIRCYSGGTITISSSNTITAIAFTFSGSYNGGMSTSYTDLSTKSWEQTLTSQARITAVTVTYTTDQAEPDPVAPTGTITFDPISGSEVSSGTTVSMTFNGTCTGIKYTIDGTSPSENNGIVYNSSNPPAITEETTITAAAYNYSNSKYAFGTEATATYTIETLPEVEYDGSATFDATVDVGTNTSGQGSITKTPVTFSCTSCNLSDEQRYRLYSGSTTTFSVPAGSGYKIVKIEFTGTESSYALTNLSTSTGTYAASALSGTWIGNAESVSFSASAQARATLINVYYTEPEGVSDGYYLVGDFTGEQWPASFEYKFTAQDENTYVLEKVLPDMANSDYIHFKIAKYENGQRTEYGGYGDTSEGDYGLHGTHNKNISTGADGLRAFSMPDCYNAIFTFNKKDMKFSVEKPQLFVKGVFNSWATPGEEMTPDTENGGWTITKQIDDNTEFRFYDAWHTEIGGAGYWIFQHDMGKALDLTYNSEHIFKMVEGGKYTFTVNSDKTKLVVTAKSESTSDEFVLVTPTTTLNSGDDIIIANSNTAGSGKKAMSTTQNANNRGTTPITITDDFKVTPDESVQVITLESTDPITWGDETSDGWLLNTGNGYLYAASSSSNWLRTGLLNDEEVGDNAKAVIEITSNGDAFIQFNGDNTRDVLRYNNSNNIFSCYTSGNENPVYLYKRAAALDRVATPAISPVSETGEAYEVKGGEQEITITCATEGATIYYTTDGTDPRTSETRKSYTGTSTSFILNSEGGNETVIAYAEKSGMANSHIESAKYLFKSPDVPVFDPADGTVRTEAFDVEITSPDGGDIYYMLDPETAPTATVLFEGGTIYENSVNISGVGAHTIYAIAELNGIKSKVASATYTIAESGGSMTLADLVVDGESGKVYTISDEDGLLGVYKSDNTVWFKDDNQAIDKQTTGPGTQNFEIEDENGNTKNSEAFDQSNWIEVDFSNVDVPESVTGNEPNVYIQNLTGTYSYNGGNPKLVLTKTPAAADVTAVTNPNDAYVPNPYIPAHFGDVNGGYFFSKPKAQEYAYITLAAWDGDKMNVPSLMTTQYGFTGSFSIIADQATLNALKIYDPNAENEEERGLTYSFHAIICKAGSASPAPRLKVDGEEYEIRPTDLTASSVPTAISTVAVSGEVKSVKYVNVAGVVSDRPFQGVNIVVTEYTDGSRTTAKMVR